MNRLRSGWQRLRPSWRWALITWLGVRLFISAWAAISFALAPVESPWKGDPWFDAMAAKAFPHEDQTSELLWGIWLRWDVGWFMKVATYGYAADDNSVAFPPLYPLATRVLGRLLGGEYLLAGMLISNAACVVGMALLYELVEVEYTPAVARRTILYLAVFPSAFYLLVPYSEALFLCLVLVAISAMRRRCWAAAGISAFVAALTRTTGWVLALPVAYEALADAGWQLRRAWRGLLASLGGPLGLLAYMLYLRLQQMPSFTEAYHQGWGTSIAAPWASLTLAVQALWTGTASTTDILNTAALLLSVVLFVASLRVVRASYWLYTLGMLVLLAMAYRTHVQLESVARYVLVLFPNFIVLGLWGRNRWIGACIVVVSLILQMVLTALFVHWIWVA